MLRVTLRNLAAHRGRLALTALAVALGVGFMAATSVLTATLQSALGEFYGSAADRADLRVRGATPFAGASRGLVPAALVDTIRAVPGVSAAEPFVQGYARVGTRAARPRLSAVGVGALGITWSGDARLSPLQLRSGVAPVADDEVVIDAATASRLGLAPGDMVPVTFASASGVYRIVGIAGYGGRDDAGGVSVTAFTPATAQRRLATPGMVDAVDVVLAPSGEGVTAGEGSVDTATEATASRLVAVLGSGYEIIGSGDLADELSGRMGRQLAFVSTSLLLFGGVAVFVSTFVVANTFSMLVHQQSREFALLRALGATRRQIWGSVALEAAAVGLMASVVGLAGGTVGAALLLRALRLVGVALPTTTVRPSVSGSLLSVGLGCLVTVAAALLPAARAAAVPPLVGLVARHEPAVRGRARLAGGSFLAAAGALALLGALAGRVRTPLAAAGSAAALLGLTLLGPVMVAPVGRLLSRPLVVLGATARLGRANTARNPRRAAATAACLMVSTALVTTVGIVGFSARASAEQSVRRQLSIDQVLTIDRTTGFTPRVAEQLAAEPAVASASAVRRTTVRLGGQVRTMTALPADALGSEVTLAVRSGEAASLATGALLVDDVLAAGEGLVPGDVVEVEFASTGLVRLPVGAIFERSTLVGPLLVPLSVYEANVTNHLDALVLVTARPEASSAELGGAVSRALVLAPAVHALDQTAFNALQQQQVDRLMGVVAALLGLAVLVALIGVVNTVSLAVSEREGELRLLRTIGMTGSQVLAMVRHEAFSVTVAGTALGVGVGAAAGCALVRTLAPQGLTVMAVPVRLLAAFAACCVLAAFAASTIPARRATRMALLPVDAGAS